MIWIINYHDLLFGLFGTILRFFYRINILFFLSIFYYVFFMYAEFWIINPILNPTITIIYDRILTTMSLKKKEKVIIQ